MFVNYKHQQWTNQSDLSTHHKTHGTPNTSMTSQTISEQEPRLRTSTHIFPGRNAFQIPSFLSPKLNLFDKNSQSNKQPSHISFNDDNIPTESFQVNFQQPVTPTIHNQHTFHNSQFFNTLPSRQGRDTTVKSPPRSFNVRDILKPNKDTSSNNIGIDDSGNSIEKQYVHTSKPRHLKLDSTNDIRHTNGSDEAVSIENVKTLPMSVAFSINSNINNHNNENGNDNVMNNQNNKDKRNENNILPFSAFSMPIVPCTKENVTGKNILLNHHPLSFFKRNSGVANYFNNSWIDSFHNPARQRKISKLSMISKLRHQRNPSHHFIKNYDKKKQFRNGTLSSSSTNPAPLSPPPSSSSSSSSLSIARMYYCNQDRKKFQCPQCRYITDRKNNLMRHIITMHQDSGKVLECCGIAFQSKSALREHNSIFHSGGYRCQICSRNFCRKALLRRHLTVHSGQKDFYCDLCGYATSHKSNLERHQKVHNKRYIGRVNLSNSMDITDYGEKNIDINGNQKGFSDNTLFEDDQVDQAVESNSYNSFYRNDEEINNHIFNDSIVLGTSPRSEEESDIEIVQVDISSQNPAISPQQLPTNIFNIGMIEEKLSNDDLKNEPSPKPHKRPIHNNKVLKRKGFFTSRIRSTHGSKPETLCQKSLSSQNDSSKDEDGRGHASEQNDTMLIDSSEKWQHEEGTAKHFTYEIAEKCPEENSTNCIEKSTSKATLSIILRKIDDFPSRIQADAKCMYDFNSRIDIMHNKQYKPDSNHEDEMCEKHKNKYFYKPYDKVIAIDVGPAKQAVGKENTMAISRNYDSGTDIKPSSTSRGTQEGGYINIEENKTPHYKTFNELNSTAHVKSNACENKYTESPALSKHEQISHIESPEPSSISCRSVFKKPRMCFYLYSCPFCLQQFHTQINNENHNCLKKKDATNSNSSLDIPIITALRKGKLKTEQMLS